MNWQSAGLTRPMRNWVPDPTIGPEILADGLMLHENGFLKCETFCNLSSLDTVCFVVISCNQQVPVKYRYWNGLPSLID